MGKQFSRFIYIHRDTTYQGHSMLASRYNCCTVIVKLNYKCSDTEQRKGNVYFKAVTYIYNILFIQNNIRLKSIFHNFFGHVYVLTKRRKDPFFFPKDLLLPL
jgi:hypothetical protein